MMEFFDSHFHLNHPDFAGREAKVWEEAQAAGVGEGIVVGYDLPSSQKAIDLACRLEGLHASVGVSPHEIRQAAPDYLDVLRTLASHPQVAAIGEAGLEYHYPVGPKEMQWEFLENQARLANEFDKPLIIHLRDADDDFLRFLDSTPPQSAVLHCFTASEAIMQRAIEHRYAISFSGILTFKNAVELQRLASQVPLEHLLVETDSPYLAPVPFRGKPCEPRMVIEIARRLAELHRCTLEEIAEITSTNARRIFKLH